MGKFVTIGERLSTTAPAVNKAFLERDPEPILKRAKQQLDAGATYLDVNIGPAEGYGPDLMKWAVELLQGEFDNVPLALDTSVFCCVSLHSFENCLRILENTCTFVQCYIRICCQFSSIPCAIFEFRYITIIGLYVTEA